MRILVALLTIYLLGLATGLIICMEPRQPEPQTVIRTDTVRVPVPAPKPLPRPVPFARTTSRFADARYHPILERWRPHRGVDYAASQDTPVRATASGTITHLGPLGGLGNTAVIRHPDGLVTRYGHLRSFTPGLKAGQRICQGEQLGLVGSTGLATGPHVHYEMIRQGTHIDPMASAQ